MSAIPNLSRVPFSMGKQPNSKRIRKNASYEIFHVFRTSFREKEMQKMFFSG